MEEVKQFKIFFSNQLESLAEKLESRLYAADSDPFRERLVIVPSKGMKFWIERFLAENSIFFGVEVLPLDSALTRLISQKCPLPNRISLILSLYERLPKAQLQENPLFAETLATLFQRYSLYGYSCFERWEKEEKEGQQKIWNELFREHGGLFTPLARALLLPPQQEKECHLFGLSHLPRPIAHFFRNLGSYFYQLSFCESFWSDILSDKEALSLSESEILTSFLEETPPLLANFSIVMRQGLRVLEESLQESEEEYHLPKGNSQLQKIQLHTLLFQKTDSLEGDDSLQLHQVPSRLREVEVLRNRLLQETNVEGRELRDILILAPDIGLYMPYLKALLPLPLLFLENKNQRAFPEIHALFLFLNLEKRRFSSAAVMEFLAHPVVKKRRSFKEEELDTIKNWMEKLHIRWGFDLEHKHRLLRHHEVTYPLQEDKNSFKEALDRLIKEIAFESDLVKISQLELLFQFYELIHQIYKDISILHHKEERTVDEYCNVLESISFYYFCEEKEESLCYRLLQQIRGQAGHYVNTNISFAQWSSLLEGAVASSSFASHNTWDGIICASLATASHLPAKITYILGLEEESFPRKETPSPLDLLRHEKIEEYLPSKGDFDRGFFFEALYSCKERLIISYRERPSLVVQELIDATASITKYTHPLDAFHPSYFTSHDPHYRSYLKEEYLLAMRETPLVSYTKSEPKKLPAKIDIKDILRFVKSPLKHTLKHKLGLYFTKEAELKEEEDFTLSQLTKALIVRRPEAVVSQVEQLQAKAAFPQGTFGKIALRSVQKKEEEQREIFASYGIIPSEMSSLPLDLQIGAHHLVGKLDYVLPRGLFVYEKGDFAGAVSAYPAFLALNCLKEGKELFFGKEKKRLERFFQNAEPLLEKIVELYLETREKEALLYPELMEAILQKNKELLMKRMRFLKTESYDEAIAFTFRHRPWPSADELIDTLYKPIHDCYQEAYDNWF